MKYALQRRSGWLARKERVGRWEDAPLASYLRDARLADPDALAAGLFEGRRRLFFDAQFARRAQGLFRRLDEGQRPPVTAAQQIAQGQFSLFRVHSTELGIPPNWHVNGITGEAAPAQQHWSRIDDFAYGDIKVLWDLSRFTFAFDLARAYARDGDHRWAELFWRLVEDWRTHNPPQQGPNWKCGQEASLRAMSWLFALFAMAGSPASTPQRIAAVVQMIAFTGERVAANIDYAVSQRNNHGVSEAVGLWTIGLVLPELQRAERWREQGRRILTRLARELIYDDGGFSQHSWNYHRLMLHDYVWAIRLGQIHGDPLDAEVVDRVRRSGELLHQVMDEPTGGVPCYGQDDGSLILPLSNCSYFDYRPVAQATAAIAGHRRLYEPGPWDEDLLWLLGEDYVQLPLKRQQRNSFSASNGGYVVLRGRNGFAFTRAGSFRHRPAQADMLHVDIWRRGRNIAIDPGTYSYNAPPPWNNPLATARYHNTVTVDDCDQMTRTGRFVWLPWLKSRSLGPHSGNGGQLCYWQGEHDGYQRLRHPVRHRRAVLRVGEEQWIVIDRLQSLRPHRYRLHWLVADWPHDWNPEENVCALKIDTETYHVQIGAHDRPPTASLMRADPASPRGWRARGYLRREPAISIVAVVEDAECWFWSALGPESVTARWDDRCATFQASDWHVAATIEENDPSRLFSEVIVSGAVDDRIAIAA